MIDIPGKAVFIPLGYDTMGFVIIHKETFFPHIVPLNMVNDALLAMSGMPENKCTYRFPQCRHLLSGISNFSAALPLQ